MRMCNEGSDFNVGEETHVAASSNSSDTWNFCVKSPVCFTIHNILSKSKSTEAWCALDRVLVWATRSESRL